MTGFKRLGIAIAAVVAAVLGVLAAVPLFIPADAVRGAIKAEIKAVTGLDPIVRGDASVSLFPWGNVSFTDIVLGEVRDGEPPLTAERLTARLRLWPLLFGRIEASDLSLARPRFAVIFDANGHSNWSGFARILAGTLEPTRRAGLASFSEIRISDGTVLVRDEEHGINETLSAVEMSLAWPSISRSFATTGRFMWRNETVDASFSLNDLFAALVGERAGLKLRLSGAPFKLAFDGHVSHQPTFRLEGTLAADTASLRQALVWAGQTPLPGGGFGRFALKAQTNVLGGTIAFSAVNVELDGNTAEGVFAIATAGRKNLQGTLAADAIDLTPYISTFHLLRAAERDWSPVPIVLDGLTGLDLDLRLSAARITLANAKLGRTAVAANLRDGRVAITIGESQAFGGMLQGSLAIGKSQGGAEIKSQLQFADVDLEACLGELFGLRRLEGKGTLTFALEASGDSVLEFTRTVNGSGTLIARRGALAGYDLEQLLRRLERRPFAGRGEFRTGRTPYENLTVNIKLVQGTATVEEIRLDGPAVRLGLAGSASIPARDLDLKGTASLVPASATDNAGGFELPFVVQGPWDDPLMLPDTDLLLRRSGAAAPVLQELLKARKR